MLGLVRRALLLMQKGRQETIGEPFTRNGKSITIG
jgi:hypothetical protein